jgi:hypothetical protein
MSNLVGSAALVHFLRNRLQVPRIHALTIMAKVIQLKTVRDFAVS